MFETSSCIKALATAVLLFIGYNMLLLLHNKAVFDGVSTRQDWQEVVNALGQPFDVYACGNPDETGQMKAVCKRNAAQVYSFRMCKVSLICQGWNFVAFDASGKVVAKYNFSSPYPFAPAPSAQ